MKKSPIALRIISLILLLGWMGLIFYLSHQNANESSGMSGGLIKRFISFFLPNISADELTDIISSLQFIVRKTAHFSLYAILGILSFSHFATYGRLTWALKNVLSILVPVLYAISDEYHQTYIPGRSGEIRDVLIDSLGAVTGILLVLIVCRIFKAIKKKSPKVVSKV